VIVSYRAETYDHFTAHARDVFKHIDDTHNKLRSSRRYAVFLRWRFRENSNVAAVGSNWFWPAKNEKNKIFIFIKYMYMCFSCFLTNAYENENFNKICYCL